MAVTNIRKGIFETNSSSVHTLCINTKKDINVPTKFKFYRGGEFGWDFDSYYDSESCGQYIYLIMKDLAWKDAKNEFIITDEYKEIEKVDGPYAYFHSDKYPTYKALIIKYENEYKNKIVNILQNAGCTDITWEEDPEFESSFSLEEGFIDHVNEAHGFLTDLLNTPDLLIHFLFGGGSIHTGNDNDEDAQVSCDIYADYEYEKGN